jgi:hypothetical protein
MANSTISTKLTTGVKLGSTAAAGIYLSPLTITPTGYIAPSNYGVSGVSASIGLGYVLNQGTISGGTGKQGAAGSAGDTGGGGVGLTAGSLINDGTVVGGSGGAGEAGGGHGGYGIDLVGALLTNTGLIAGGHGGPGFALVKERAERAPFSRVVFWSTLAQSPAALAARVSVVAASVWCLIMAVWSIRD